MPEVKIEFDEPIFDTYFKHAKTGFEYKILPYTQYKEIVVGNRIGALNLTIMHICEVGEQNFWRVPAGTIVIAFTNNSASTYDSLQRYVQGQ